MVVAATAAAIRLLNGGGEGAAVESSVYEEVDERLNRMVNPALLEKEVFTPILGDDKTKRPIITRLFHLAYQAAALDAEEPRQRHPAQAARGQQHHQCQHVA